MTKGLDYSVFYDPEEDFDRWYTRAVAEVVVPFIRRDDRVLELGAATGLMTSALVACGARVTAVERSDAYLTRAYARGLEGVEWVRADLDEWTPNGGFDHVTATNLLHEVSDPVGLLRKARSVLDAGGLVHVSLQNPYSIHRQVAVDMGLLDALRDLSATGQRLGSHGLWDADEVARMGREAGLKCILRRGLMLKPLPNDLMSKLPVDILDGYREAAIRFPDLSAMNYLLLVPDRSSPLAGVR